MSRVPLRGVLAGSRILAACAAYQIGLGLYFMLLRPSLLPEDMRFAGSSAEVIRLAAPYMESWLHWVFVVVGGQMIGAGALLMLASSEVRRSGTLAGKDFAILSVAGTATALVMSGANFAIESDFRWALLAPVLAWIVALGLLARAVRNGS